MSDTTLPQPPEGRSDSARTAAPLAVAALFDPDLDTAALERMLLAAATHPNGAGFDRASLLIWSPDRDCLDGRLAWAPAASRDMDQALVAARQLATEGTQPDVTRRLRALRLTPEDLEGSLALAWTSRGSHLGLPVTQGPWEPGAVFGAIVLMGASRPFGLVVGEWWQAGDEPLRHAAMETYRTLADAALRCHQQSERARRGTDLQRAWAQFAQAAVASQNVAELGNTLVRLATQVTGARGAVLWRATEQGALEVSSNFGPAGVRDRLGRGLTPLAERCLRSGRSLSLERAAESEDLAPEVVPQVSTVAAVPVIAYGRPLGVLAAYDRVPVHPNEGMEFDVEHLAALAALADHGALALEQARGEDARQRLEQARRDLLRQLGRSERQAAAGEWSTRAAHEARNPLASIGAFARRVHRSLAADDPNREYLEVVIRETDRLTRALTQPPEAMVPETPRFRMESLNALVQSALQDKSEQLVRRRIRLLKRLSPDLPPLLLDADRLGRVLRNVLEHALERVSPGGRVRIESRRVQQFVVVEVANDGLSEPGEMLADLFVPFTLGGTEGGDLGLAMARQVVWQHGGEIRVRSEAEWSSILTLTLPVRGNEERRRPGTERRVARGDRRQRVPTA